MFIQRLSIFIIALLSAAGLAAQSIAHDSLDWQDLADTSQDIRLRITTDGNFEEDQGTDHKREYRFLLGRWTIDTAAAELTLGVDGLMASGVHPRYRRGRDYYMVFAYAVTDSTLLLTDVLTGRERRFRLVPRAADYEDPSERRKPDPKKKRPPLFELPELPGGKKKSGWGSFFPETGRRPGLAKVRCAAAFGGGPSAGGSIACLVCVPVLPLPADGRKASA